MNRGILSLFLLPLAGLAQIDQQRAAEAFNHAKTLCEREGGKLWKISLCGPIVIADPATKPSRPTSRLPRLHGRPLWDSLTLRWTGAALAGPLFPGRSLVASDTGQGQLLIHELFHRIQPQLGLLAPDLPNDHLDTREGRYWMQLEWKALSRATRLAGRDTLGRGWRRFGVSRRAQRPVPRRGGERASIGNQ